MMSNKKYDILIGSIVVLTLAMRLYMVRANLPYIYWHDENNYIEAAMRFGSLTFSPITFSHGGLYQLILFVAYGVFYVLEKLTGLVRSPADFYVNYIKDPTPFFFDSQIHKRILWSRCGVSYIRNSVQNL
jgi:hypothetical protein